MYALAVSFDLDPSRVDVFKVAVLKNAKPSLAEEPGCRQFDVCFDAARPAEAFLYEVYDDEAAFNAHMASPHFATFESAIEGIATHKDVRFFNEVHQ